MDGLLDRIQELELRTRKMERLLLRWRLVALLIGVGALIGYVATPQGHAQPGVATANNFTAPFTVRGTNGVKLFEVTEFVDRSADNSQDTLLTLYRNGRQAAMYRTTGKAYKDAYDPAENYLNVVETWLYRYPLFTRGLEVLPRRLRRRSASRILRADSSICFMTSSPVNMPTVLRQPWV